MLQLWRRRFACQAIFEKLPNVGEPAGSSIQSWVLGRKFSDEFTVPLCRGHHREVHRCGDEVAWWNKAGIDPTVSARALWLKSHQLPQSPASYIAQTDSASTVG